LSHYISKYYFYYSSRVLRVSAFLFVCASSWHA